MKFKKWKKLLKKDKAKACEVLARMDWKLGGAEPIEYEPEELAREVIALHTGSLKPFIRMSRKELLREGRRSFEIDLEDDDEGASSSDAPTAPSGA